MAPRALDALETAAQWLRKHFDPDAARGFSGSFRFRLLEEPRGVLTLRIEDGVLALEPDGGPDPEVVITLAADDLVEVLEGRANGELLFMAGRVQIAGPPARVLRLRTLFRRRV